MYAARLMGNDTLANRDLLKYELTKFLHSQPNYWQDFAAGVFDSELSDGAENIGFRLTTDFFIQAPASQSVNKDDSIRTRILEDRKVLYRDRGHLHGRLHQAETNAQRYEIQKLMVAVQGKINKFNADLAKIDNGETPEKYLQATTTVESYKSRENYQKYIRRYKQKIASATDSVQIKKYQAKIEEYLKKLEV